MPSGVIISLLKVYSHARAREGAFGFDFRDSKANRRQVGAGTLVRPQIAKWRLPLAAIACPIVNERIQVDGKNCGSSVQARSGEDGSLLTE
jgi:hypothetical protein